MSPYTRFCSGLLFPLHERLKGHRSVAVHDRLEASQWWPPERIAAAQAERLREFLIDVGAHVPHYRELFERLGFDPAGVRNTNDLRRLPRTDKAMIRARTDALRAEDHGPLARFATGGSSGEPLVFHVGKERIAHDVAAKWRATRWWSVDIGDPELVVWGSPIELGAQDRVRRWRDAILRSRLLPAFDLGEPALDGYLGEIRRFRPRMLFGYPSALTSIARHAERRGVRVDDLGVRVAFVTSERLYDDQRETLVRVFGCPVANGYGARDAGFVAHECPSGSLHVMAEDLVVELLDAEGEPVGAGELGEITVTHLATRDFPFVRYRTGDMAIAAQGVCACGRGLPMLREVQGRATDFVVAVDGTPMHGLALIYVLRDEPTIEAFRVVQETRRRTVVQIVPSAGFNAKIASRIAAGIRRRLGAEVAVVIEPVERIAPEPSGKYRYVVSHAYDATVSAPTATARRVGPKVFGDA